MADSRANERQRTNPRRGALVAGLCAGLFLASGAAVGESQFGDLSLEGEITLGGRLITGDDWSSAQFNEYTKERPGFVGSGNLLLEDDARMHYLRSVLDFVDQDDQHYELGYGRWGHYGVEMQFDQFPHRYSSNAQTPYSRGFNRKLLLSEDWYTELGANGINSALAQELHNRRLGYRNIDGEIGAFYKPSQDLRFDAGYRIQDKKGTKWDSTTFGFSNFVNVAKPVEERTHEITGSAQYAQDDWSVGVDYLGSFFENNWDSYNTDNPLEPVDTDGASHRGRVALSPDNSAHQVSLSGAAAVPTSFPSRIAGTFSYGVRLQNEDFVPYTINSALVALGGPADQKSSLPKSNLDGKVNTILANLVYTARPTDDLNVDARYRIYDFDNDSDSVSFIQRVPYDNSVDDELIESEPVDFTKQNAEINASYRLSDPVTLETGFEWEKWHRSSEREVRNSNEYTGTVGFDIRPDPRIRLHATGSVGGRDGAYHSTPEPELPQLRKFDEANRFTVGADWRAVYMPRDDLTLGLQGALAWDDYDSTNFGLKDDNRWRIGFDFDYSPFKRLSVSGYYTYDWSKRKQQSMNRSSTAQLPSTDPERIWDSRALDSAHNVGVDVDSVLWPEVLDARVGYVFQYGVADTNSGASDEAAAGDPVDWPQIKDWLHIVTTELTWHVYENVDLLGGYRFEYWRHHDYQTDPLGVNFGDNNIYLNNHVDDYTAHVITLGARYTF